MLSEEHLGGLGLTSVLVGDLRFQGSILSMKGFENIVGGFQ